MMTISQTGDFFLFFRIATAVILDFLKNQNFDGGKGERAQTASNYQIF